MSEINIGNLMIEEREELLDRWLALFAAESDRDADRVREDGETLYRVVCDAIGGEDVSWDEHLEAILALARSRVAEGFAADETTLLLGTLRRTLLRRLAKEDDLDGMLRLSRFLDRVLEVLMNAYVAARDDVIARQREDLMELSTPTVQLWDGIVALPLVGTLDSRRAVVVMESLLSKVAETRSAIAILDVTGVPMVDTLVAQHLLKTVAAARLTGATCILCGIRPQIAQTMVELGIDLGDMETRADLAAAFEHALALRGLTVGPGS